MSLARAIEQLRAGARVRRPTWPPTMQVRRERHSEGIVVVREGAPAEAWRPQLPDLEADDYEVVDPGPAPF